MGGNGYAYCQSPAQVGATSGIGHSPFFGGRHATGPSAAGHGLASMPTAAPGASGTAGALGPSSAGAGRPMVGVPAGVPAAAAAGGPGGPSLNLAELGAAFSELEHIDESALVGQAQLGSQMQSQLRNFFPDQGPSLSGDTPRLVPTTSSLWAPSPGGGAPPQFGFGLGSPKTWAAAATSPKARAASTHSGDLPPPGPSYKGPRLEPADAPITAEWAMKLVYYFQQHPRLPLPARYLVRLLDEAERILDAREEAQGPVQHLAIRSDVPKGRGEPQLTIVGDTHGQLADVLWIFYKQGVPSPTNRYLFNGDICDRGQLATEIWALLLVFMCVWPESVSVQRGNHEDRLLNMDFHCGGFFDEVLMKYGRGTGVGLMVYEKFCRLFARLPLATIVDNQVFVVHGGLSRNPAGGFLRMLRANKSRTAEVPTAFPHASPVDLAFVDAMWADPQEAPRVAPNPRGQGLTLFGPDITHRFLAETGLSLVVRSHQVPPNNEGYFVQHGGKLVTVFSASNYCGLTGNTGAVLVLRPGGACEALQHWAPPLERLSEVVIDPPDEAVVTPAAVRLSRNMQRQSTASQLEIQLKQAEASPQEASSRVERLEREVLRGAARLIVERKAALFAYWEDCDSQKKGFVTKHQWEEAMRVVLGDGLPWKALGKALHVKDTLTKDVDYRRFLGRFRVTVVGMAGGDRWAEELLGRFYGRLLALRGDAGSLEELEGFLAGGDGKVSPQDALEAFRWVLGNTITEEQATALLRTLAAHAGPSPSPVNRPLSVFEFLSRLDVCFQHQRGISQVTAGGLSGVGGAVSSTRPRAAKHVQEMPMPKPMREATPWARSVLLHLGRFLWMEDAEGSPKSGSTKMLEVFRYFDEDRDGLLQRDEFAKAVKELLAQYATSLPPELAADTASDERIDELVDCIDYSGDGMVNYLEFMHAFQPVDRTPGRGLQTDLMEQVCTTIWGNKPSLLRTMQILEESGVAPSPCPPGHITRENLRRTLRSLNASLEAARGSIQHGAPLTEVQIDILVDHAAFDDQGFLDYQAFLEAFQIVDLEAPEEDGAASPMFGAGPAPAVHNAVLAPARGPVYRAAPPPAMPPALGTATVGRFGVLPTFPAGAVPSAAAPQNRA